MHVIPRVLVVGVGSRREVAASDGRAHHVVFQTILAEVRPVALKLYREPRELYFISLQESLKLLRLLVYR